MFTSNPTKYIMAKAKLSLTANPTFKSVVAIPVPGGSASDVEFTFKGRTRSEFNALLGNLAGKDDVDTLLEIACGWDLIDAFDRPNLELLTENYIGASAVIIKTYLSELTAARLGN